MLSYSGTQVLCDNVPHTAATELEVFQKEGEMRAEQLDRLELLGPPTQPITLRWNIQSLAKVHGINNVAEFGRFMGVQRQTLYGLWYGTAVNVSVARLERLTKRLGATPDKPLRPGDWFRWESGRLTWNVKALAEQLGMERYTFAFRAGLFASGADEFWSGKAKYVFVRTLSKLAVGLETDNQVFDFGELLVRESD